MASLSHASSFATPNTQQTPLPKLLPSHLSMDPTSSSVSTLSQQHSSSELSWLQKPSAKLSYTHLHTMSSFNHQFGLSSPLYEGYSEAGDSIDQGFIGGDDPLLTSSWEALDKLVSASMTNSGSANEPASMHVQSTSPSPISEVEQKPLSGFYSSNNQKGGVCNMWANNDQASQHANANTSSNGRSAASSVGLNLASLISADPGFVERAAKFSSYSQQINQAYSSLNQSNNNINPFNNALSSDNGKLSNYNNSSSSYKCPLLPKRDNVAMDLDAKSDLSALHKPCNNNTTKMLDIKRSKSPQAGSVVAINGSKKKREGPMKEGEVDDEDANHVGRKRAKGGHRMDEEEINNGINNSKVSKVIASERTKTQQSGGSNSGEWEQKSGGAKEISTKPCSNVSSQAPKPDFIHVRARRGQATDSHSLAERVRREKISERMKYLQDLVPGCTKVTGKAMMLDEIINYVQSLQRQVEFLSMKLAAVNPSKLEFNFESLFGKEVVQQPILQHNHSVSFAPETHHTNNFNSYPFNLHENLHLQPNPAFPESNPSASMHSFGSDAALRRTVSLLAAASSDTFGECISQITDAWEDDLHNIVHLAGFAQTPQNTHPSLQGALLQGQMKAEL